MSGSTNKRDALRLPRGLDDSRMTASEGAFLAQDLDPVLVYVILRYLRDVYPASNPAANAVLDRVVALTSTWPGIVGKSKEGEQDPVSMWFTTEYSFGDFRGRGSEGIRYLQSALASA